MYDDEHASRPVATHLLYELKDQASNYKHISKDQNPINH